MTGYVATLPAPRRATNRRPGSGARQDGGARRVPRTTSALALGPLLVCGLIGLAGCPQSPAVDCPTITPSCPSTPPSFQTDVGPLFARYCSRCHSPDGGDPGKLLRSYDEVSLTSQRRDLLFQISSCRMPKEGEPRPTEDQRGLMLSWLACCAASDAGTCPP